MAVQVATTRAAAAAAESGARRPTPLSRQAQTSQSLSGLAGLLAQPALSQHSTQRQSSPRRVAHQSLPPAAPAAQAAQARLATPTAALVAASVLATPEAEVARVGRQGQAVRDRTALAVLVPAARAMQARAALVALVLHREPQIPVLRAAKRQSAQAAAAAAT